MPLTAIETKLYYDVLRIRLIEEGIAERYSEQEMRCPVHLSIGQEAVAVGVCSALQRTDYAMSGHRSHAHYLAKGGSLKAMLAELYGKVTGCCGGKGGSMHLVDLDAGFLGAVPIVGSTIPIAVGTALASSLRGESRVTVTFFGEGATEEGVFHESVNMAALKKLPVVFVCENNFFSVYSPLDVRQPSNREVYEVAAGHGIPSFQGDGNDVEEVRMMATEAVERARNGGGPTFLEFKTYRWREHCGPHYDNDIGYRTPEEYENWRALCPVERSRAAMMENGSLAGPDARAMEEEILREIEAAFSFARESPYPDAGAAYERLHATPLAGAGS